MSDLAERIAEILDRHRPTTKRRKSTLRPDVHHNDPACTGCDWTGLGLLEATHRRHVATEIAGLFDEFTATGERWWASSIQVLDDAGEWQWRESTDG